MLDNQFKSDVVKILKKLTEFHLDKPSDADLSGYVQWLFESPLSTSLDEISVTVGHDNHSSFELNLAEAFNPGMDNSIFLSGDGEYFTYGIVGDNEISASIQADTLTLPNEIDAELSAYSLPISISGIYLGDTISKTVYIDFDFI